MKSLLSNFQSALLHSTRWPLASNPRLLRFCTSMPMISPTQRTLFQSLISILKRTMARGWGGGRVICGRVHAIFNQEITPLEPRPNIILFDLLHCYKKFIHAVGDHRRPRKKCTAAPYSPIQFIAQKETSLFWNLTSIAPLFRLKIHLCRGKDDII